MKAKGGKAVRRRSAGQRSGQAAVLWLGLACGAVVTLVTPTALLAGALLAPGLAALATDHTPGRPVARCVLLSGLAATVAPVRELWEEGHTLAGSLALLTDPSTVGVAWTAAAAGWLLCELTPIFVRLMLDAGARSKTARLRAARERLETEWGFEPRVVDTKSPQPDETG
jgi:putative effector of murein hydrolase LrgA (UPF0299 family)